MRQPLAGIRVLDLGTRIAAPFCAGILGEQGAEVIKIEDPGRGDMLRELGPSRPTTSWARSVTAPATAWSIRPRSTTI